MFIITNPSFVHNIPLFIINEQAKKLTPRISKRHRGHPSRSTADRSKEGGHLSNEFFDRDRQRQRLTRSDGNETK